MTAILIVLMSIPQAAGWSAGDLDQTLAALPDGKVALVEVSAGWCGPCNQLQNEVLDTPAGDKALDGAVGIVVDFDSAPGQAVKRRYGVLGIPTTLVLAKDGTEIGRVEGYDGRDDYLEALRDAKAGRVGLAALATQAAAKPDDVEAQVAYAQARLVRGDVAPARAVLDALVAKGGDDGARAARVVGRWLLRVKEDAPAAIAHFKAMLKAYDGTKHYGSFVYWLGKSMMRANDAAGALAQFDAWAARSPESPKPAQYRADFMVHYKLDLAATRAAVDKAIHVAPEDPDGYYLLARTLERSDALEPAHVAIDRAIALAPGKALYANYKRGLPRGAAP